MDYSYKAIQKRISDIVEKKEKSIAKIGATLKSADIDDDLKIKIWDTVHNYYKPELKKLTFMAIVAEWHELPKREATEE